jgi:hypothetical protein
MEAIDRVHVIEGFQSVMPGHSRQKDGVASARLCPGIHVLTAAKTWMAGTHAKPRFAL